MKKAILPLIALFAFSSMAWANNNSPTGTEQKPSDDHLITHGSAGPFSLKAGFPGEGEYMGYELVRKVEKMDSPDGPYEIISYECQIDGVTHMEIFPNTEDDGSEGGWISEIKVVSDVYKTEAGIGVGSTIDEFYAAYDDAEALYTYISGAFWLETKQFSGVQFQMKGSDYAEEPSFDSDLTELDKGKFKKGAQVDYIRIY